MSTIPQDMSEYLIQEANKNLAEILETLDLMKEDLLATNVEEIASRDEKSLTVAFEAIKKLKENFAHGHVATIILKVLSGVKENKEDEIS